MSFSTSPSPAGSAPSPTSPPTPPSPPPAATSPPTAPTLAPTSPPAPSSPPPIATPPPATAPLPAPSPPPATTPPPAASPPPIIPSAPPPSKSTAPPPAAPPPSTPPSSSSPVPATPSVPPATPPSSPPPPSPPTPSTPPPPLPATPSIPLSPPQPPKILPPPPPPPHSSSNGVSSTAVGGIVVGVVVVLVLLTVIGFCYFRKKRRMRPEPPMGYSGGVPPSGDNFQGVQSVNWQQKDPPPAHDIIDVPMKPYPPQFAYRPPHPVAPFTSHPPRAAPAVVSSSEDSSGSQIPLPPPPPPDTFLSFGKSMFTIEELSIATNGFSEANLLGQGGFGHVYKGTLQDEKDVAIKKLKPDSAQGEREFRAEVEIISRVHHRHLVSLVGYCISGSQRLLVYEYVPNGTLDFHLHGENRSPMDWPMRLRIALGSAKGLAYLHEDCIPKIIHRDVKASNILLDFNFEAKVADFGLAKLTTDNSTHVSTRVMGTFGYLAPEYANSGKLTDRSDVFSFGVVLLELITGKKPIDSDQTPMYDSLIDWARPLLTRAIEDASYDALIDPRLENYNPREMAQMIACAAACIHHSARIRPKMSQIVRALEGHISCEDLNQGVTPSHSSVYGSQSGSDYDSNRYAEEMRRHRQLALALASRDYPSTEYSAPTSEYGLNVSITSGEGPQSREMEREAINVRQGNNSSELNKSSY